jgi:exosortase E/protease (VPEID-CTERM system)
VKERIPSVFAIPRLSYYSRQLGLVALLIAELLYLTVTFDTQSLDAVPSIWARLIGWAPQYLRLAVTVTMVMLVLGGKQLLIAIRDLRPPTVRASLLPRLVVHAEALLLFIWVTAVVLGGHFFSLSYPAAWCLAWFVAGAATLATWCLAFLPRQAWLTAAREHRGSISWGLAVGTAVWAGGFLTQELWTPLARYTFRVVEWTLSLIYPATVSDPSKLVIGTPTFKVMIAPTCSGFEGIGLILAFLSVYLWLFRRDLRFPGALALLPMGVGAIWIINALRIVALIVIGTSGWPNVARGGFHSQAGWLAFNVVGLGFAALTIQGGYFMSKAEPVAASPPDDGDPTTAYLAPFMAILATAMLTGAFSAGFEWLYPLRVFAAGAVLWMFRKSYRDLNWTLSGWAIAIGCVTFLLWLALIPNGFGNQGAWPAALRSMPWYWATTWLLIRVVGYVVTVPLVEELAFRGYLTRRVIQADFQNLPVGIFSWSSFLISSVLFGAVHGGLWLAGTIAGMSFALALYRRRSFGDAVQAHATTNALIALYVFTTGRWSVWS